MGPKKGSNKTPQPGGKNPPKYGPKHVPEKKGPPAKGGGKGSGGGSKPKEIPPIPEVMSMETFQSLLLSTIQSVTGKTGPVNTDNPEKLKHLLGLNDNHKKQVRNIFKMLLKVYKIVFSSWPLNFSNTDQLKP